MDLRRSVASLVVLLLAVPAAGAPPASGAPGHLIVDTWDERNGFPAGAVASLQQAGDGAIWLAGAAGLFRFDGLQFGRVPLPARLDGEALSALALEREDDVVLGTASGAVVRLREGLATDLASPLSGSGILSLAAGRDGSLLALTAKGVARRLAERWVTYPRIRNFPLTSAVQDDGDRLWIGTLGGGVCLWTGADWKQVDRAAGLPSDFVLSLVATRGGGVWAGTGEGLARIRPDGTVEVRELPGLSSRALVALAERANGELLLGPFGGGVYRLGREVLERFVEDLDLQPRTFLTDRYGRLWVVADGQLRRYRETPFRTTSRADGLPSDHLLGVLATRDGSVFLATAGQGVVRIGADGLRRITAKDGLGDDTVWSLGDDRDGHVWFATDRGATRLGAGGKLETWGRAAGLPADGASCVTGDSDGIVWIGTFGGGLGVLSNGRLSSLTVEDGLPSNVVLALARAADGGVFIGTDNGLARAARGRLLPLPEAQRLRNERVPTITQGADRSLWVAANDSLVVFSGGMPHRFAASELSPREFKAILEDGDDLWVVASERLTRLSRRLLLEGGPQRPPEVFDRSHGLAPSGVGPPNGALLSRAPDGRIWFATLRDLVSFQPGEIERLRPASAPPISVFRVLADSRAISVPRHGEGRPVTVPAGTRRLEIEYSAVELDEPASIRFRHRLVGYEDGWVDVGARRASHYMNLSPGTYRFELQAFGPAFGPALGPTGDVALTLRVEPLFHQTPLFYALVASLLAGLALLLHRLRAGTLEARAALLEERNRIAREIHDTLAQGFTGIVIQLNAAGEVLGDDPETARSCVERARDLATRNLEEARRSVQGLAPVVRGDLPAALETVARQVFDGAATEVSVRVEGTRLKLPEEMESELLRIGQEALTNARKHAEAKRVELLLSYLEDGRRVRLVVRDDGHGLPRPPEPRGRAGFGLVSMRERARRIGARLSVGPNADQGTEVTVDLPLVRSGASS